MLDNEEYFPRGGKKPANQFYKQSSNFLGLVEQGEKKRKKPKKRSEDDDGYLSDDFNAEFDKATRNCARGLSYSTVKEGVTMLGRIRMILETKIMLSLPCRMAGTVMACHISEPYTKILNSYVNEIADNMKDLRQMFKVGQYVAVRVLVVENNNLQLSMMPQHVNNLQHTDLYKGTLIQAAVVSTEDNGHVVDLGIPNTRSFLPKNFVNSDIQLDYGSLTWCVVKNVTSSTHSSIVTVSNQLACLRDAVVKREPKKGGVTGILPGSAVEFVVDKALDNGIEGTIFRSTTSYVQSQHADSGGGRKPAFGQKIKAWLLYDMPTRKTPFFTLRNIFEDSYPDLNKEQKYKVGDVIVEAQVIKISGRSITFKLGNKCIGTMNLRRVRMEEDMTDEQVLAQSYPLGSKHKVRVLSYNLADYRYSVTDEADALNEKYFTNDDVKIGDLVDATVHVINDNNLILSMGRLKGSVPLLHMADTGMLLDNKKMVDGDFPRKKFKVGQQLKTRILSIKKDLNDIQLTLKPSLLDPDLEVLCDYDRVDIGKSYVGYIQVVKEDYLLVMFFNNVTAFIPKYYVTRDTTFDLPKAYHIGQIVNCTILKVDPAAKKMTGSLTTTPFYPNKKREPGKKRKIVEDNVTSDEEEEEDDKEDDGVDVDMEDMSVDNSHNKKFKKSKLIDEAKPNLKSKNSKNKKDDVEKSSDVINEKIKKIKLCEDVKKNKRKLLDEAEPNLKSEKSKNKKDDIAKSSDVINEKIKKIKLCEDVKKKKTKVLDEAEPNLKSDKKNKEVQKETKRKNKKNKTEKEADSKNKKDEIANSSDVISEKIKKIKLLEDVKPALELPSVKDFWSTNVEPLSLDIQRSSDDDVDSSDDETNDQPKKKRRKLSAAEKVAKAREEEERLREMERRAIESESQPRSTDQFERALLANPNSSELWIAYIAFHLQATEIDKARNVGRKAIKTISFREEQDKLNVWLAMLNLENRFGTQESLQATLYEAVQVNEPFQVHSKLLDIYVDTSKQQELNSLVELMLRKYKRQPENYVLCGTACYKLGMVDKARYVMQKAVSVLEKKEHVSVLVQFALLERSLACRERAEALFEQVLGAYPQRVDVCATYVDMLYKNKDVERVRQVMERMTSQKLPARKMKILYKKWIELEEKIGNSDQVDKIRQKAMEFIENAQF